MYATTCHHSRISNIDYFWVFEIFKKARKKFSKTCRQIWLGWKIYNHWSEQFLSRNKSIAIKCFFFLQFFIFSIKNEGTSL